MGAQALLDELVDIVGKESASDIHLSEGRRPTIRVSSYLIPLEKLSPVTEQQMKEFFEIFLTSENVREFALRKEANFGYAHKSGARFRGNVFETVGRRSIALRLIPTKIRNFEELNLPPVLRDFAAKQQGFFLVVGPAGHGKSTTLAAMVEAINQERLEHIVTIEDPIEFLFTPNKAIIDQREVKIDTPDFHTALWGTFRQDVDVIMVGEMREPETIATAVTAAETGHLVLSTLHTNTASQTVDRIIDSFPPDQQEQIRVQLSSSLIGIFSQRLVPRVRGGLIPAYELLLNNNAIANLIREKRTHEINAVIETGSEDGMIDFNRSLIDLVRRGEITPESAYQYSTNPKGLERMI